MITVLLEQNQRFNSAVVMTGEDLKDCVQKALNTVDVQYITPCCMVHSDILCWCSLPPVLLHMFCIVQVSMKFLGYIEGLYYSIPCCTV
jgi:hypothetical protein